MWEYQGTEAGLHVVEAWEGHALPPRYRHYWTTLTKAKNDRPRSVSLFGFPAIQVTGVLPAESRSSSRYSHVRKRYAILAQQIHNVNQFATSNGVILSEAVSQSGKPPAPSLASEHAVPEHMRGGI